jgi:hypothetical protein
MLIMVTKIRPDRRETGVHPLFTPGARGRLSKWQPKMRGGGPDTGRYVQPDGLMRAAAFQPLDGRAERFVATQRRRRAGRLVDTISAAIDTVLHNIGASLRLQSVAPAGIAYES